MEEFSVDIAIIGSGPAGQKAAIQAAKLNKKVAVIERDPLPGGACLYSGTIPSKSLREAIMDLTRFFERSFYGRNLPIQEVSINDLNHRLNKVIEDENRMIARQLKKNGIQVIHGTARFEESHYLAIFDSNDELFCHVKANSIIIASGSKPRNPPDVPFNHEVILDSTRLLAINKLPQRMIVLGGGIIGAEYSSFFAALGTEVVVIDKKEHILPMLDAEIGIHLQTALTDIGLKFIGKKEVDAIKRIGNKALVQFRDGSLLEGDVLLYALGRTANIELLQVDRVGIAINDKGYIIVNALFQTTQSHIYAVGDVIGGPCLASTSMEQGRLAARHACGIQTHHFPNFYPIGIYTIPEISSCGYTEDSLKEMGFRYEVGRAYYYEIARSHITGAHNGLFKILFHIETLEILGIHIIGRSATEMIHIGQVAMSFNARLDYFINQIFNYPTYAEGYRIAALNGFNKVRNKKELQRFQ